MFSSAGPNIALKVPETILHECCAMGSCHAEALASQRAPVPAWHCFHLILHTNLCDNMADSLASIKRLIDKNIYYTALDVDKIYCNPCGQSIKISKRAQKYCIISHENGKKHKKNAEKWTGTRQISTKEHISGASRNEFFHDITELFVVANIPLEKLAHPIFAKFVGKWCLKNCPDCSTLRRYYMKPFYEEIIRKIQREISDSCIYVEIDEAIINGRKIYSIIVGRLDGEPSKPFLLDIMEISENPNNINAAQSLTDALQILWPERLFYERVRLLLTDQASYMVKAGENLRQGLFPNILHITCICHALSRVCEEVKQCYPCADKVITNLKIVLSRCPRRVGMLEELSGCPLVSFPVSTRWGTWIRFANYVCQNFGAIKQFVESVFEEDCSAIGHLLRWMNESELATELQEIFVLKMLPETIQKLETRNLPITEQRNLVEELRDNLPARFKNKLDRCLSKNPSYHEIFAIRQPEVSLKYIYAPLTSVEVERSFSQIKHILTEQRGCLSRENFRYLCVSYCNANKLNN